MKKIKITVLALSAFLFMNVNAQDIKPVAGSKQLEVNVAPGAIFTGIAPLGLINGGIQYKQYLSETNAFRLNVNLGSNSASTITSGNPYATPIVPDLKTKNSGMNIMLAPGLEKHFKGTDRLSPYIGAALLINFSTLKSVAEYKVLNTAGTAYTIYKQTTKGGTGAGLTFGLGAVAGADYYIAKHLYLGAEMGFGLVNLVTTAQQKVTSDQPGVKEQDTKFGTTMNLLGAGMGGMLKLGFTL